MIFQFCKLAIVLLMILGGVSISSEAQEEKVPAKELVQYIHDSKQRGVKEEKIKQQAIQRGWPAAAVEEALAYEKGAGASTSTPSPVRVSETRQVPSSPPGEILSGKAGVPAAEVVGTPTGNAKREDGPESYRIGSGDTLQVSVWKEPEASVPSAVVRPDGMITIPMLKDVEVAGLTPKEAENVITAGLSKYINDVNVTVVVAGIASKKIYLIGAVKKEGTLSYTYGMTLMQALSEAGGLTDYAKRKKIYILRTESGREYRLDFNYDEVVKGERMDQNIVLLPGDTVVIPH